MDEKRFLALIAETVKSDIPREDLDLRQMVKLAGLTFTLCGDVDVVSRKKLRVFIPKSKLLDPPSQVAEEVMLVVVRLLFRDFSRFQSEQLAKSWLRNPPRTGR